MSLLPIPPCYCAPAVERQFAFPPTRTNDKLVLVFGGRTGWIAQQLVTLLNEREGIRAVAALSRLEDRSAIAAELDVYQPWRIVCAAGVTGRPNVDYLETHKAEALRTNVVGLLTLCDLADARGIHVTNMATGCIYEYDAEHPMGSGIGFKESDAPNFTGSWYSLTKGLVEPMLRAFPRVLTLRLRMPISDDLHPRNFVTKITKYAKVVDVPNSMSVLHDLLPVAVDMALAAKTGVYNFCNPGTISHNQILAMYREYVDSTFTWANFTVEEQALILEAGRSNNELDVTKLVEANPQRTIPHIQDAVRQCFQRMREQQLGVE